MLELIRLIPLVWRLAAIAAGVVALGGTYAVWRHGLIAEGEGRERTRTETQNQGAKNAADAADLGVDACYAAGRVWDAKAGKCRGP